MARSIVRLAKATLGALLTLIVRPLLLFVLTGAVVTFVRYTLTMVREMPSLLYELSMWFASA